MPNQPTADEILNRIAEEPARIYTYQEICELWVWVSTLKRFIDRQSVGRPGIDIVAHDKEAFNDKFAYVEGKKRITDKMFRAKSGTIRKLDRMVYLPNEPEFPGDGKWNQWRESPVKPVQGDTTLFHEHLKFILPNIDDRRLLKQWMGGVLRNPETKPRHQLLMIGNTQRSGKSFFIRLMAKLVGESNWQPLTQDILSSGFTGWATHVKLVTVEEVRNLDRKSITDKLHVWASESAITVNEKMLPTFRMEQSIAFMLNSNKDDPLALDVTDGRYLVLRTEAVPHPEGPAYYARLYGVNKVGGLLQDSAALSAILYHLLHYNPDPDYSIEHAAPRTAAKAKVIEAGANETETWMLDHEGTEPLTFRVVEIAEVVQALPKGMQNAGSYHRVREGLKKHFQGKSWPIPIRPDGGHAGKQIRVWTLFERKPGLTTTDVLTLYREDHPTPSSPDDDLFS